MKEGHGNVRSKFYYVFMGCMTLAIMIMGATFAYFSASATDSNTITGNTATVTFGLSVTKVTDVDNAFGLIPMYDHMAPAAASSLCEDDRGNPVCQIYRIDIKADSTTVMFLDGYITMNRKEGVDVAFTEVELVSEDEEGNFEFKTLDNFDVDTMVGTGVRGSALDESLNRTDDADCLLFTDRMIGGSEEEKEKVYYVMVWLHDTGTNQNDIQGVEMAYTGTVTFITSEGNEISASFD